MRIKIFERKRISWSILDAPGGFEGYVNDFCSTVNVIDIVVVNASEIVVKYKDVVSLEK